MERIQRSNNLHVLIVVLLLINLVVWSFLIFDNKIIFPEVYFLDVGQGDANLIVLPKDGGGTVKILNDAGDGRLVLSELSAALGAYDNKYIDLLILSHPHEDHYGGYNDVLEYYDVGAFVFNGHKEETDSFLNLLENIEDNDIPTLALEEGGRISYLNNEMLFLSPDENILSTDDINEASLVFMLNTERRKVLFTGDIGFPTENTILEKGYNLDADVLKVGHHGSRFSSGVNFIEAVSPTVSIISVGENNTHGQPDQSVIEILEMAGSRVYMTKDHGTIRISLD